MKLAKYLPILSWLPEYNRKTFRGDLLAGITVGVMLVPQGMAYAMLAGLPLIYGLYAGIVPLFLYAFFGSSRQLSVGPVALVSLLVLTGISALGPEQKSEEYIQLAIATSLIAGVIQILLGFFRLGFLVNFLSHPVIAGFTSAAAFIIGLSQLKNLLGIEIDRSFFVYEIIGNAAQQIHLTHIPTLLVGLGSILFMLLLKRWNKAIPNALIAVILTTLLAWGFGLQEYGVQIVGDVPKGLPDFELPVLSGPIILKLLPLALTICLISFIESLAIAKTIQARHKNYKVNPNQELLALGITKVGGAFFQSFPTTGSFTRSAINDEAGAKTGISSIISAGLIALTLIFLTPLFYYLPNATLAAIVVVAVIGLIDVKEARYLWKTDRRDFFMMLITFLATMFLGIQEGVLTGVAISLALMIYNNSKPHVAVLGKLPETQLYRNIIRFPDAVQDDELLIIRFDAQLYFGNASYFEEQVEKKLETKGGQVKYLILDASNIHDIDSSGAHAMKEVVDELRKKGVEVYLSGAIGPVRDMLFKSGLMEKIGWDNHFLRVHDAVIASESKVTPPQLPTEEAKQTNVSKKQKPK
jgi:SulP family sulfate permease